MPYPEQIDKLLRQGAKGLGEKDYETAVEVYGKACELYQQETGETDADLLLLYGKALFESGVSQSDVLGGQQVTSEKIEEAKGDDNDNENFQFNDLAAEEAQSVPNGEPESGPDSESDSEPEPESETSNEGEGDDNKNDLELAWDVLEVARGLFTKKLKENEHYRSSLISPYLKSDKDETEQIYIKTLKLLSEVYDLLGEVSLEAEHFPQAASDLEECLELRKQLYDAKYSSLVGESHFKLSLALEFCLEDEKAKEKARSHIKEAIQILENDNEKNPEKKTNNDEIIQSLQERYDEIGDKAEQLINQQKQEMLGILGSSDGSDILNKLSNPATATPVNDLTSVVKKRKPTSKKLPTNQRGKRQKP